MKRFTSILLLLIMITSLMGCSGDEKLEELLLYIEYDIAELASLENELTESYNDIVRANNSSSAKAYQELATTTMNLASQLNEKATLVSYSIKNPELLEIHSMYVEYTNILLSAFTMIRSAFETNNASLLDDAIEKATEAAELGEKFRQALDELANEYNIDLTDVD